MANDFNTKINVDDIMKTIRKEVLRKRKTIELGRIQLEIKNHINGTIHPNMDHYHMEYFLNCSDDEFIQKAFSIIYKRYPDPVEIDNLKNRMNKKMTRIYILGRMRYSSEGRGVKTIIHGLVLPFIINAIYRIPLIGYLLRLFISLINLPLILQQINKDQMDTYAHQATIEKHVNQNSQSAQDQINTALDQIEIALNQLLDTIQSQK